MVRSKKEPAKARVQHESADESAYDDSSSDTVYSPSRDTDSDERVTDSEELVDAGFAQTQPTQLDYSDSESRQKNKSRKNKNKSRKNKNKSRNRMNKQPNANKTARIYLRIPTDQLVHWTDLTGSTSRLPFGFTRAVKAVAPGHQWTQQQFTFLYTQALLKLKSKRWLHEVNKCLCVGTDAEKKNQSANDLLRKMKLVKDMMAIVKSDFITQQNEESSESETTTLQPTST